MKIIRHVYKNNDYSGIGDFIRGTCYLWDLCQSRNYKLEIQICNPLFRNFLDISHFEEPPNIPFFGYTQNGYYNTCNQLINHVNSSGEVVDVSTNLTVIQDFPKSVLSQGSKQFIREYFKMTKSFKEHFESIGIPEKYSVIHIRLGDPVGPREISSSQMEKIQSILKDIDKNQMIYIMSDNCLIRDRLASIHRFHSLKSKTCHLKNTNNLESIRDTLTEFFLLSKASHIYQMTTFPTPSGFSFWTAKVYEIPIQYFRI